jgi:CRISPR system Cascade subunit CasD
MPVSTLVLRFAGSAQSWASSPYAVKDTEPVPTRSGVLGMIAAALGAPRGKYPEWLAGTVIAVRVDHPGTVVVDYHTVNAPPADVAASRLRTKILESLGADKSATNYTVPNGDGAKWGDTLLSRRAFLSGAEFIVAINHPDPERLQQISDAVAKPVFMTYLGRKAFAPTFPYHLGIHSGAAHDLFEKLPTASQSGAPLRVHLIEGDQNEHAGTVNPTVVTDRRERWMGWKTV